MTVDSVGAGDRLISVNDVNLEGLPHATTVEVLQNAPDDVTLVVSQPKERLYKGIATFPLLIFLKDRKSA